MSRGLGDVYKRQAEMLIAQDKKTDPISEAAAYVNEEKGVAAAEDALQGAMDIIAEDISDNAVLRKRLREVFFKEGTISSKAAAEDSNEVYKNYFEYAEPVNKIAGHRILALDRGEKEEQLKVAIKVPEGVGEGMCTYEYVKNNSKCAEYVRTACEDSYKRLIFPSIEREVRAELSAGAQEGAIKVFASNLRQLIMAPPVKDTVTLGLDPGYAHGCKCAVVDSTGKVLDTVTVSYTHLTLPTIGG